MRTTAAILLLLLASSSSIAATKCRNGTKILYLDDRCPPGYTDITTNSGGTVSTMGKSANVQQQEQEFLAGRDAEARQYQAQLAQEQRQIGIEENNRRNMCNGIAGQIRSVEIQMRQINAWQIMDQLKQNHRALRDQQYQLGCHR